MKYPSLVSIKILSGYESYLRGENKLSNIDSFTEFVYFRYRIDPNEKLDVHKIMERLNSRIIGQPMIKQIYWQNPKTGEEKPYKGYFWNKSHQIADSLGGTTDRENLVTGTRTQNVGGSNNQGGMQYAEIKAKKYLEDNRTAILYYEVLPIYQGSELIPRGSVVRMLSSDGSIDEKILVPNHAYGGEIDYTTGFIKYLLNYNSKSLLHLSTHRSNTRLIYHIFLTHKSQSVQPFYQRIHYPV